jgi:hypothetical protein
MLMSVCYPSYGGASQLSGQLEFMLDLDEGGA